MSTPEPTTHGPEPTAHLPEQPRYEPPPSVGKLALWVLLFVVAAVVVVLGGLYLT
ncbi:hypothetical protein [Streptomyces mirabilis]|jgi:hypothetical protein|uniref:Uncharacterized protein n=1 Tax=Streptomyces mirabilis TaxID=68239 RepID=A0A1I2JFM2_9ACTN|nr:hypothetical protein [Streptomyces mirabilis]SFF53635.1 hypothetical protein SAMN02787118_10896 [Streptomyces mirabilis]